MAKSAIDGGDPVCAKPFPSWPQWGDDERKAITGAVRENIWGTLGPRAMELAKKFPEYCGAKHGVSVTSGTVALELIIRALGIGYGDEVIVSPYTFVATISAIAIAGATPVIADIELPSYNISPESFENLITSKTKAVICVHVAGLPCDMDKINATAKKHGIYVIEDASHAHGAEYGGKKTGSLGDAAAFSFQNSKNLSSGEGGIIVTNDEKIYAECWRYHHSGRALEGASNLIGTNARMTEFQAAVLLPQLERYEQQLKKRIENAVYLKDKLCGIKGISVQFAEAPGIKHACHLFMVALDDKNDGGRDEWVSALNAEGIPASRGYINLTKEGFLSLDNKYFRKITGSKIDYASLSLPNAEKAVRSTIWMHGSVLLSEREELDKIAEAFDKVSRFIIN